jgi:NAD+ kinase
MAKVGIVVNLTKDVGLKFTSAIIDWLQRNKCEVLLSEITASQLNRSELGFAPVDIYKQADFLIVLGGDGTLLGVARQTLWLKTPILGVNMGRLGFITEVEKDDIFEALEKVINGEFTLEERMMLEATVIKDDVQVESFYALNDIGVTKGTLSRMITLKTYIENNYIDTYHADGLLISTPTGSTAYSLSAGGPIVNPGVSVILITPICPHSLNSRSIVVSDSDTIAIDIVDNFQEVHLTCDGQQGHKLKSGDRVIIKKAPFTARLVKVANRSFYDVLRTKLKERTI